MVRRGGEVNHAGDEGGEGADVVKDGEGLQAAPGGQGLDGLAEGGVEVVVVGVGEEGGGQVVLVLRRSGLVGVLGGVGGGSGCGGGLVFLGEVAQG